MKRLLAILLLCVTPAFAQTAHYGHSKENPAVVVPDDSVTPGVIRTTDASEICAATFRTKPFRLTTQAMKNQVYKAYGVERMKGMCKGGCEVDHRVPLELGGKDDPGNLWPQPSQPAPGFHEKDALENALKRAVCTYKKLTLKQAQDMLQGDWYKAFENVVGE